LENLDLQKEEFLTWVKFSEKSLENLDLQKEEFFTGVKSSEKSLESAGFDERFKSSSERAMMNLKDFFERLIKIIFIQLHK
jgi:hypothetical protein